MAERRSAPTIRSSSCPNLLGSPHNSGDVPGIMYHAARQAAGNVRRYLIGDAVSGVARREDYAKLP